MRGAPGLIGLVAMLALLSCQRATPEAAAFQGVVEFDERVLSFETGGRVTSVAVQRGFAIRASDVVATLDDTLERTARESREAEANVARARAALVRAGSRPESIRAVEAQLRAAIANEELLTKKLEREARLRAEGATPQAAFDEIDARRKGATAEREALEQRVREVKNGARKQEIDSAEAQVVVAGTAVKFQSERVARYSLQAGIDGTVLDVHVKTSEMVGAGTPVVTVGDTAHPYVDVFVPQARVNGIIVGASAAVRVDSVSLPLHGAVENVARRTEFTPRFLFSDRERANLVVRVRVRVDDPERRLHAGVPAFVTIDRNAKAPPQPVASGAP